MKHIGFVVSDNAVGEGPHKYLVLELVVNEKVLVKGVVSSVDKFHFWSVYFPNVRLGMRASEEVLPNITVSAWLNMCVDPDGEFYVEFDSFERVESEDNIVAAAPWNRNNLKYSTLPVSVLDDGLENQILPPDSFSTVKDWQQELINAEGICTGRRLIYNAMLPSFEFTVALFKNTKDTIPLAIGVSCDFDAVWNEYEKKYIVTRYRTKAIPSGLGANGLMKTSVKAVEQYPGLFKSDVFGLLDDPRGVLSLFHLSTYKRSSVVVTLEDKPSNRSEMRFRIVDVQPDKAPKLEKWMKESEVTLEDKPSNRSEMRFRIVDVQPDKAPKLGKWMKESEITVNDAKGIVLDASTVYSKDHANIFFKVPEEMRDDISPGKMVKFSARYQYDTKQFVVFENSALGDNSVVTHERKLAGQEELQRVFLVSVTSMKDLRTFLNSSEFGLVDLNGIVFYPRKNNVRQFVWVARSVPEEGSTRSARTPFFVVSIGEKVPKDESPQVALSSNVAPAAMQSSGTPSADDTEADAIEQGLRRLGIKGGAPSYIHGPGCTQSTCAADCEAMNTVKLLMEKVNDFWEQFSEKNPDFFTECVNKIFN
ncbi:unnamed protein product [Nippostrongylus brasiliensis]|uniref:Uncharacterized protein n=1 Tax=Nippostrongylus brasiliensis TaxID=27835 RepID=A0A0N4YMN4_NIPBR|nr:unnamed protein product [Nippostrongylus brasiliensis]